VSLASVVAQVINGLAGASTLFLVAAGLSLIFGVTRIVNFAHGSFYMLGLYVAFSAAQLFGATGSGWWVGIGAAALSVALLGAVVEMALLRRLYRSPELFQLLATFALVLLLRDAVLAIWGADSLLGPRAPGLSGAASLGGQRIPVYDLFLIAFGVGVLGLLWLILRKTRFGTLVRAATQDREMVGALGINERRLFTFIFALGSGLAGLGGALQLPREPLQLGLDLGVIAEAFVVVVVGGMGSLPGAYLAALLIAGVKALCITIGDVSLFGWPVSFSALTLVVEFVVMAAVLVFRPQGLLGRPGGGAPAHELGPPPSVPPVRLWLPLLLVVAATPLLKDRYLLVLLTDILCFALFAAALHFLIGLGGIVSFGHAAFFGAGAYASGLLFVRAGVPMEVALALSPVAGGLFGLLFGWFCVRLSGIYFAMLTLALAQLLWSVAFQWVGLTGGSNGLIGVWPAKWLNDKAHYLWLTLAVLAVGLAFLWRLAGSPFGMMLRGARDSVLRAEAIGINVPRIQLAAFGLSGMLAGIAGGLYAFSKGSISPDLLSIPRSVDALVMVFLGGLGSFLGPVVGAAVLTWAQDEAARLFDYWRAVLGLIILAGILAFPRGLTGQVAPGLFALIRRRRWSS
jgi:branched-chain amino acid transport system permease protein